MTGQPSETVPTRARGTGWRPAFLNALAITGVVSTAATHAGISRPTAYRARHASESFRRDWDNAIEQSLDSVEQAVMRRAIEGTDMHTARWVLAKRRPDVWGDKVEHQHTADITIRSSVHEPTPEMLAEILKIREEIGDVDDVDESDESDDA